MPSITIVTIQSALLKSAANITAQVASRWNSARLTPLDWSRVAEFATFGIVSAPIAYVWQTTLEEMLPSQRDSGQNNGSSQKSKQKRPAQGRESPSTKLNWGNIVAKLMLDQTIGQLIMNMAFLLCTRGGRLGSLGLLLEEIQTRIPGLLWTSWKIWPWVAIVNFIWVPVDWRVIVASVVGFGWNVFLSIFYMAR